MQALSPTALFFIVAAVATPAVVAGWLIWKIYTLQHQLANVTVILNAFAEGWGILSKEEIRARIDGVLKERRRSVFKRATDWWHRDQRV